MARLKRIVIEIDVTDCDQEAVAKIDSHPQQIKDLIEILYPKCTTMSLEVDDRFEFLPEET